MPERHRRAADNQKGFVGAMMNGKGMMASRSMILFGFPLVTGIVTGLAAYAGNLLLDKFDTHFAALENRISRIGDSTKSIETDISGLRIDVTKMQVEQTNMKERMDRKGRP